MFFVAEVKVIHQFPFRKLDGNQKEMSAKGVFNCSRTTVTIRNELFFQ